MTFDLQVATISLSAHRTFSLHAWDGGKDEGGGEGCFVPFLLFSYNDFLKYLFILLN